MRKIATALTGTALGLYAVLSFKSHSGATFPVSALSTPAGAAPSATAPADPSPGTTAPATTGATPPSGGSGGKSGTFDGAAADTDYGPVQVRITVASGKLTDVTVLQVPDRGGYERQIVSQVLPMLKSEALSKQNADIDVVSGATYTSQGYARSLQSALDQAGLK